MFKNSYEGDSLYWNESVNFLTFLLLKIDIITFQRIFTSSLYLCVSARQRWVDQLVTNKRRKLLRCALIATALGSDTCPPPSYCRVQLPPHRNMWNASTPHL
jgi:hypothetical protein